MTARAEPRILIADDWRDYVLIDSGDRMKLEQVGPYRFVRPEPLALWRKRRADDWEGAHAVFSPAAADDEDGGRWRFNAALPEHWPMRWDDVGFLSRPTPFRHLAFFPEHSVQWRYARETLAGSAAPAEVLNLFGYTGLASLACAKAGARVTHVDASKKAIGFARENAAHAGLAEAPIRWICDDALAFVRREARRGRFYQGLILDPPKFGRGPKGETWRFEESLSDLMRACAEILAPEGQGRFIILSAYAVRMSALALAQIAADATGLRDWEFGEMALPHAHDERLLPTAMFARWRS
jgi:23S rRNA (cytosine1962-C5)-methyltransferase